jgi:hypothetical protein
MSHYDHICSRERFAKDTANHQIQILRDDGVYRHILCKEKGTSVYHFNIVTWPGYLAITGDMGANLFSRTEDMFKFFRADRDHGYINPGYWAEKLQCDGERDGVREFDSDKFTRVINEYRVGWMRSMKGEGIDKQDRRELWEAIDNQVLCYADEKHRAELAAYDFSHKLVSVPHYVYHFTDLFEHSFSRFTHGYIWRCRAIAWAIEQYDLAKAAEHAEGGSK